MDREKNREEMEKDLTEIFDEEYEKRRLITPAFVAEKMTAKGYHKQSEGEWRRTGIYGVDFEMFKCSNCRQRTENGMGNRYCPNCGAKMNGGTT